MLRVPARTFWIAESQDASAAIVILPICVLTRRSAKRLARMPKQADARVVGFGGGGMHGYRALEGTFLGGLSVFWPRRRSSGVEGYRLSPCQSASAFASVSGEMVKRGLSRRDSGTDGHQASVSRTVSASGRNPRPAAIALTLFTDIIP